MTSTKDTVNNGRADDLKSTLPTLTPSSPTPIASSERPRVPHPVSKATFSVPSVIPPEHSHRTLVLCFDGTGDQFDADNSNIVQLVSLLKKNDRNKQMVYYQSGIGTYTPSRAVSPRWSTFQKVLDHMVAWSLNAHVMGGYEFLMQNYIEGDKICIFGFSRGAYTARSLAGMLHKVGLLPADNFQQIPFAYKMYTRVDHIGWEQSTGFKKAFCSDVTIDFIGVWDTVDSVGIFPKRLPFTTSNGIVRVFRHAISLDERRSKFKTNLWSRSHPDEHPSVEASPSQVTETCTSPDSYVNEKIPSVPTSPSSSYPSGKRSGSGNIGGILQKNLGLRRVQTWDGDGGSTHDKKLDTMEAIYSATSPKKLEEPTNTEEVWFAGCHCDVGGGAVSNKTRHSLARISLRWMIRECFKTNTGIMFESEGLQEIGLDPATLYPFALPRPPPLKLKSEHKIQKPPADPIPVRPHATLYKKRPAEIQAHHTFYPSPFLGSEEAEELQDALSPAYDQLKLRKGWWILEILPIQLRYQRGNNEWVTRFGSNLARPRFIPKQITHGVKVHRSVKMRMEAEYEDERKRGKRYRPKAQLRVEPTWID
ncbi:hypothetical protein AGABI1DRAFT_59288 [Agaricus bisporus var. burnettii JB137-S8]|uniref:T6SS Phospholipase effector Tle1-like catalytic domain-containing protein n=1 Tax=Agaricus bisporus var. burnettii (strain JB137-S8 / ATCC MYA-4627 / FGSC 10392) TaxID=597362 RepID=K5WVX9_AGABU|nr:uncharacterized protein AGABI1DRAFT_59288 [Agaricus bisporus var. burnettii JB137-S8]EKM79596.1 hypothetical protein AGABI1DRAFT_59288 [Agaricus bisporus var. burnettii JB137-S8]